MKAMWIGVLRLVALALDWFVIALWGGTLFGIVVAVSGGQVPNLGNPWATQAIGFIAMTVPVVLYFAVSESSRARATLGKRVLRLSVSTTSGERLPLSRSVLRSAVKFAPWEIGHTVANQAIHAGDSGLPIWVWALAVVSLGLPVIWVVGVLLKNRTPYDAWSGAVVAMRQARSGASGAEG